MLLIRFVTARHDFATLVKLVGSFDRPESWLRRLWLPQHEAETRRLLQHWVTIRWQRHEPSWLRTHTTLFDPEEHIATPRYVMDLDSLRFSHELVRWLDAMKTAITDLRRGIRHWRESKGPGCGVDCETPQLWVERDGFRVEWFLWSRIRQRAA